MTEEENIELKKRQDAQMTKLIASLPELYQMLAEDSDEDEDLTEDIQVFIMRKDEDE